MYIQILAYVRMYVHTYVTMYVFANNSDKKH